MHRHVPTTTFTHNNNLYLPHPPPSSRSFPSCQTTSNHHLLPLSLEAKTPHHQRRPTSLKPLPRHPLSHLAKPRLPLLPPLSSSSSITVASKPPLSRSIATKFPSSLSPQQPTIDHHKTATFKLPTPPTSRRPPSHLKTTAPTFSTLGRICPTNATYL